MRQRRMTPVNGRKKKSVSSPFRTLAFPFRMLRWKSRKRWTLAWIAVLGLLGTTLVAWIAVVAIAASRHNFRSAPIRDETWLFGNRTAVDILFESVNHPHRGEGGIRNLPGSFPLATSTKSRISIYFNIYIPDDNTKIVTKIVREQLYQITSILYLRPLLMVDLYYVTIGAMPAPPSKLQALFSSLSGLNKCVHVNHYQSADEMVTLQALHTHCHNNNSPDTTELVVYLHSKGTFHDNSVNTAWRRALTAAALHCALRLHEHGPNVCHVCGLQFYTQFAFFVPGNMWAAECSYVRPLLPPVDYRQAKEDAVGKFLTLRARGILASRLLRDRRDYYGLDRYASEHWVGSHPDIVPCDMDPDGSLPALFKRNAGISTVADSFDWHVGARHVGFAVGNNLAAHEYLYEHADDRLREYYLLAGHLLTWYSLYEKLPDRTSWVWKWFPDGGTWHDSVRHWGPADVVETVNSERKKAHSFSAVSEVDYRVLLPDQNHHAVFFHVHASLHQKQSKKRVVLEQLTIVKDSFSTSLKPTFVFHNSDGAYQHLVEEGCVSNPELNCHCVSHSADDVDTLQQLFKYCAAHPLQRVTYINNAGHQKLNETFLLQHMTAAAISHDCQHKVSMQCNVCGLAFYTMPTMFFPGNMFTAACSYVNELLPPAVFVENIKKAAAKVLLAKLRKKIIFQIIPESPESLGLENAMADWIGSHPSLRPCDLSPKGVSLEDLDPANTRYFDWAMAPRQHDSPFGNNSTEKRLVYTNTSLCRRENQNLAGRLLKWIELYNSTPPQDSWIWKWFPEGRIWSNGVAVHKNEVVDALTQEYADVEM